MVSSQQAQPAPSAPRYADGPTSNSWVFKAAANMDGYYAAGSDYAKKKGRNAARYADWVKKKHGSEYMAAFTSGYNREYDSCAQKEASKKPWE